MAQEELAAVSGIAREVVSKYANGTRGYTRPNAERMAPHLDVTADELMRDQAQRLARKRALLRELPAVVADLCERVENLERIQGSQRAG